MSDLEKVIYLADMLSPERRYPEKEYLTKIALRNLDTAMEAALRESIRWIKTKGGELDEDSLEAYKYFRELNNRR
jgi:HD superfamily phosphohydrolase YqeK